MPEEPTKTPKGRPSIFSQDLADTICARISLGESMRSVCRDENMPPQQTIFRWFRERKDFCEQYERACAERTDSQQEDLLEMGDLAIQHAEATDPKAVGAVVSAYKLKADNLKWSMSKMKPKKYGDKLDVTSDGEKIVYIPTELMNKNNIHHD